MSKEIIFGNGSGANPKTTNLDEEFIGLWYRDDERICFRAFPPKGVEGSAIKKRGTFNESRKSLEHLNRDKGIYFVVNAGGDEDKDITRINACFAEDDERSIEEQHARLDACPLRPTARVVTKRSVQAYWKVRGPASPAQFRQVQCGIIAHLGSDKSIVNPSRVMRVPGFDHIDKEGNRKPIHCTELNAELEYTIEELLAAFPAPPVVEHEKKHYSNGTYATRDSLLAELSRRIMTHPTARQNDAGNWDCNGVCHDGEGNTGLFYTPATNRVHCNSKCDEPTILRAFGLPERPTVTESPEALILYAGKPMKSALKFVEKFYTLKGLLTLYCQNGTFYAFNPDRNCYEPAEMAVLDAALWKFLEEAFTLVPDKNVEGGFKTVPFDPNLSKVTNVVAALKAVTNIPASKGQLLWIDKKEDDPPADDIMACKNGLLRLSTRQLLPGTPRFYTQNGIDLKFDADAPSPAEWLKFLNQLWANDTASIDSLQEWFGYFLTQNTAQQKALLLVGPKRSGKGTIARVLQKLAGQVNVCAPTLSGLSGGFGTQSLIGKLIAIISDARLSGKTDSAIVVERLLSIIGEDTMSVPRKHMDDWIGKLSTRFLMLTNETPQLSDASGAIASRFIVLTLTETFIGKEDIGLLEKFAPELPGILIWALDGLDRLTKRKKFIQPESSADVIEEFEDLGSPVAAFVREKCEIGPKFEVKCSEIFDEWKKWCEANGRNHPGFAHLFGRNLHTVVPKLGKPKKNNVDRKYLGIRVKF